MSAAGLGAVIGAFLAASVRKGPRREKWMAIVSLSFPALVIALALSHSFALSLVVLIGIGFSFVLQDALATTLLQMTVPSELRGRVTSLSSLTVLGMGRAGAMQAGVAGDLVGAPLAVGAGALVCLAANGYILWHYLRVRRA
jgi:hypothetical protein